MWIFLFSYPQTTQPFSFPITIIEEAGPFYWEGSQCQETRVAQAESSPGEQVRWGQGFFVSLKPPHCLPGSPVPQCWRVLEWRRRRHCHCHHHASRRHLHSRMQILCRQDQSESCAPGSYGALQHSQGYCELGVGTSLLILPPPSLYFVESFFVIKKKRRRIFIIILHMKPNKELYFRLIFLRNRTTFFVWGFLRM